MPRYFFHRTDGYVEHDNEGIELPDNQSARVQAVMFAGETLKEDPSKVWAGQEFRVEVTNESGTLLFTIAVLAFDSPSTLKPLKPSGEEDGSNLPLI